MMWRWFNLDEQGCQEMADEQKASWDRIVEIEARATNRRAESGEKPLTWIGVTMGFQRSRAVGASPPPLHRLTPGKN